MSRVFLKGALPPPPAPVTASYKPSAEQLGRQAGLYVNPTSGSVTFVTVKDGHLIAGRTTGPALVPIAKNRFWFAPQRVEWEFKPNGDVVATFKSSPPRQPVTSVRREKSRPSHADLERYAGT